jgi:hypothetical protein
LNFELKGRFGASSGRVLVGVTHVLERVVQELKYRGGVLRSAKPFWWFCGGVILAFFLGRVFWDGQKAINRAGAFLQLLGVAFVAKELGDTGVLFERSSVLADVKCWFAQLFGPMPQKSRPDPIVGNINVTAPAPSVHMTGMVGSDPIASLKLEIAELRSELVPRVKGVEGRVDRLESDIRRERQEREHEVARVGSRLKAFAVGSRDMAWVGLGWLLLATIATGFFD